MKSREGVHHLLQLLELSTTSDSAIECDGRDGPGTDIPISPADGDITPAHSRTVTPPLQLYSVLAWFQVQQQIAVQIYITVI